MRCAPVYGALEEEVCLHCLPACHCQGLQEEVCLHCLPACHCQDLQEGNPADTALAVQHDAELGFTGAHALSCLECAL